MQAQSADGVIHEFPDGTDMAVIGRVMKGYATRQSPPPAVPVTQQPLGGYQGAEPAAQSRRSGPDDDFSDEEIAALGKTPAGGNSPAAPIEQSESGKPKWQQGAIDTFGPIAREAQRGWTETPRFLTPGGEKWLRDRLGAVAGETAAGIINSPANALALGAAALRGGQQAVMTALTPIIGQQAARDLSAIPEAFPFGHRTGIPGNARLTPNEAAAMREAKGWSEAPVTFAGEVSPGNAERAAREAWQADMARRTAPEPQTQVPPRPTRDRPQTPEQRAMDEEAIPQSPVEAALVEPSPGVTSMPESRAPEPPPPARQTLEELIPKPETPASTPAEKPSTEVAKPETPTSQSGAYVMVDPKQLTIDPSRFQFKASDERGVTGALHGINRWESALANPITAWEGADGNLYVVNGHQRTDLAIRAQAAGQENVQMPARIFREADGYTPEYMRALGAYQNMAEGSGTAVDAAKVLRSANLMPPDRRLPDLPPKGQIVAQAQALAKLSPEAFGVIENGIVPPGYAAHVGQLIADPTEQMAALDMLARAQPANTEQARLMVQDIRDSGFLRGSQTTLFGEEDFARSLVPERARVLENALRNLRRTKGVFRAAVEGEESLTAAGNKLDRESNIQGRTENEQLLDRLQRNATTRGPISDALTVAASELADGKPPAGVVSRFLTQARRLVRTGQDQGIRSGDLAHSEEPAREAGPAVDLLDQPIREPTAPHTPEPTIQSDPNQIVMPGMEPSARQAQAARDNAGPPEGQKPANEGLFAPDTSGQTTLYSFPGMLFDPKVWRGVGSAAKTAGAFLAGKAKTSIPARQMVRAGEYSKTVRDGVQSFIAPMSTGTPRAQAHLFKFANALRNVTHAYGQLDKTIARSFEAPEREAMGRAMDNQSVFEQRLAEMEPSDRVAQEPTLRHAFDAGKTGVAGLEPRQRDMVEIIAARGQEVWNDMREAGLVPPGAEGLPYYFARQMVMVDETGNFSRTGGSGNADINRIGENVATRGPMRREHLTPEETEAAAKAALGKNAVLIRDIRSVVQKLATNERSIAGADLLDAIKEIGRASGTDLVVQGDIPGLLNPSDYFTLNHPSFRRWTGSGWQNIHVAKEFKGPMDAVLTTETGDLYRAFMKAKGATMGAIMWSPFMHLGVEMGRAFPLLPGKIASLRFIKEGATLRTNDAFMEGAIKDGLAPIGQGWSLDPVKVAEEAKLETEPRSWAGKILKAWHDLHQKMLWDQVFNLQVTIYDAMKKRYEAKGFAPDVAGTMAAHLSNRFAGALPPENLSKTANQLANITLFSRSFTLGNLGVMKDAMTGMPSHVRAQIEQLAGPDVGKSSQKALRRTAQGTMIFDIALMYALNAVTQTAFQFVSEAIDNGFSEAANLVWTQWLGQSKESLAKLHENPLNVFGVFPQHHNEPGKKERAKIGHDIEGRATYLRLPAGKVGEEFIGWPLNPGTMFLNKMSPLIRPLLEAVIGEDTLRRGIIRPGAESLGEYAANAGRVVRHFVESQGPLGQMVAHPAKTVSDLKDVVVGGGTEDRVVQTAKMILPALGLGSISVGYPGGEQAGQDASDKRRVQFDLQQVTPDARRLLKQGKIDEAVEMLSRAGADSRDIRRFVRSSAPGMSANSMRRWGIRHGFEAQPSHIAP